MILISGIEDIKNKVIRAVSEKFKEDPLRVYRVARFASKLDFEVEEDTIKIMTLEVKVSNKKAISLY